MSAGRNEIFLIEIQYTNIAIIVIANAPGDP